MRLDSRLRQLETRQPTLKPLIIRQGYHASDYTPGVYHDHAGKVYTPADVDTLNKTYTVIQIVYVDDWQGATP